MKLGIVIRSGSCQKEKILSAFQLMERCGIEPYFCVVGMEEAGKLFSPSARPVLPVWVCCHDLLSNQDVLVPMGRHGLRAARLKRYAKRGKPIWFRDMLLTNQYIKGTAVLRFLHQVGCDRYLVLGGTYEFEQNAHCLLWNLEQFAPDSEDSVRKAEGVLCDFCYFTES